MDPRTQNFGILLSKFKESPFRTLTKPPIATGLVGIQSTIVNDSLSAESRKKATTKPTTLLSSQSEILD